MVNPAFVRPLETGPLCGNAEKAFRDFGWRPTVTFKGLVDLMEDSDLAKYS